MPFFTLALNLLLPAILTVLIMTSVENNAWSESDFRLLTNPGLGHSEGPSLREKGWLLYVQ